MTGTSIANLQTMLEITADGVFSAETETAVLRFQNQNGLVPTGQVDFETWNAIVSTHLQRDDSLQIKPNETNAHLYPLQAMLAALGTVFADFPAVEITGIHDEKSVAAVLQLQKLSALPETGKIGMAEKTHLLKLHRLIHGDGTGRLCFRV